MRGCSEAGAEEQPVLCRLLVTLTGREVGADAERGERQPGAGSDSDLTPVAQLEGAHNYSANQLVDHSSASFRILLASRLCIVNSSMNPGLACCENSPPDSPKDARERS